MTGLTDREAAALADGRDPYTRGLIKNMTPDRVAELTREGKLNHLLAGTTTTTEKPRRENQVSRADLAHMTPAEIVAAQAEGRLDDILDPHTEPTEEKE